MKKSVADAGLCLLVYLVLAVFLVQLGSVPLQARGYPTFLLIASAVVNAALLLMSIRNIKREEKPANSGQGKIALTIGAYILVMGAYLLLIPKISYIASTVLFIFVSLLFLGVKSKPVLILLPIVLTLLIYYAFTRILMVYLPIGTWFYINL